MTFVAVLALVTPAIINNFLSTIWASEIEHGPSVRAILHKNPSQFSVDIAVVWLAVLHFLVALAMLLQLCN